MHIFLLESSKINIEPLCVAPSMIGASIPAAHTEDSLIQNPALFVFQGVFQGKAFRIVHTLHQTEHLGVLRTFDNRDKFPTVMRNLRVRPGDDNKCTFEGIGPLSK